MVNLRDWFGGCGVWRDSRLFNFLSFYSSIMTTIEEQQFFGKL
jgi:hypothetical protein